MKEQLPALIVIVPLLIALLSPLVAYFSTRLLRGLGLTAAAVSFVSAVGALGHALTKGPWHYYFGNWAPPWGIEYVIDPLSGLMAVLVSFLSLVVLIYTDSFLREEGWLKQGIHYALYLLLTAGLLGMTVTGDVFNLYVFLEISSLSAYGLIASGGYKATVSAFRYVLVGTVGASFYLLGVGYLYAITGSLNMADLTVRLQPLLDSQAVLIAMVLILVGMGIKMALFPLHGWLPDAYTYSPPAAIPFIAGVMTKVMAYVLLRYFFFIFGVLNGFVPLVLEVVGWIAALGIILASVMAIAQSDFRRMLAFSSVAQVGYIGLGLSLGNMFGFIGAVFHIINHAIMKCCLFLVAGGVKWKTGEHLIEKYAEMSRRMPLTMGAFLLGAFSMVGIPPTAGFFSKWYLILGAIEKDLWIYVVVIILSSLLNAIYFFRVIEQAYLKKAPVAEREKFVEDKKPELPATMLVPIVVLGACILVVGILNEPLVSNILLMAFPGGGL
ncbi:MAG TPA: monovalent cation/H+ antiporter subunit D family protein [Clostridia bacterium]|jgi:multicomponent Na+:H+ antiporter subunit D|nr:monovalent cation/H+ antiporter subunit D family protein [Clostridia bacterium]